MLAHVGQAFLRDTIQRLFCCRCDHARLAGHRQLRHQTRSTRFAQQLDKTYTATLPFLTVNYSVGDRWSVYGQYARGFLMPWAPALKAGRGTMVPEGTADESGGSGSSWFCVGSLDAVAVVMVGTGCCR